MENKFLGDFTYPGKAVNPKTTVGLSDKTNNPNYNLKFIDFVRNYSSYKKNAPMHTNKKIKYNIHKKSAFRMLAASFLLAIFLILIIFCSGVFGISQNNSKFAEYDNFIWPVVMQDPDPFNEQSQPSKEIILNASVWKAASEKRTDDYNYDIYGRVLVNLKEVITACHALFGDKINISLENINPNNKFYEYAPEKNIFYVDAVSYDQCFMPQTVSITNESEHIIALKVNYITVNSQINLYSNTHGENHPEKIMEYRLKKDSKNNYFYIYEIRKII